MLSCKKQLFIKLKVAKDSILFFFNLSGIIIILCLRSLNRVGLEVCFCTCFCLQSHPDPALSPLYYRSTLSLLLFLKHQHGSKFLWLLIFSTLYRRCSIGLKIRTLKENQKFYCKKCTHHLGR